MLHMWRLAGHLSVFYLFSDRSDGAMDSLYHRISRNAETGMNGPRDSLPLFRPSVERVRSTAWGVAVFIL